MRALTALLFSAFSFAAFAADSGIDQQAVSAEIANTLACGRSVKALGSEYYEVFEKNGLTYARSETTIVDGELGERKAMQFTFTDGKNVFVVNDPFPMTVKKDKNGHIVTYENMYSADHTFRLDVPFPEEKKSYCFIYNADVILNDRTKRFEETPPASCSGYPVRTAARPEGQSAIAALQNLQYRIQRNFRDAMSIADVYKGKNSASDESKDVIAALEKFKPDACKKIRYPSDSMSAALQRYDKKSKFYSSPATDSTKATGAGGQD